MTPRTADDSVLHDPAGLAALAPTGFTVGTATSAFPTEGAIRDGGREPSNWDAFMVQDERIADGSDASVAADAYGRIGEDVRLLRELGVDAHRFSFGWSRLQPGGRGGANRQAVAHYDRLIDDLLAAGIRPHATLHHFDMPEPLQAAGGWLNRDTASRLADYAFLAGEAFGDRIDSWTTITDPATVMLRGYATGLDAPGSRLGFGALKAAHLQLLGHGRAVEALRAAGVTGGVGIANLHRPVEPATDRRRDELTAELYDVVHNRLFADPILLGRYPEWPEELRHLASGEGTGSGSTSGAGSRSGSRLGSGQGPASSSRFDFDEIDPADLEAISRPIDFWGLDYAGPARVRAGAGTDPLPFAFDPWPEFPATSSGEPSAPGYLAVALRELGDRYGDRLPPVHVAAIGASHTDVVQRDGSIDDAARAVHLGEHLAVAFAGAAGVDVSAAFLAPLVDGWEWTAGFGQPRGLVHVHRETQDRTPKRSYRWLQSVLGHR